MKITKVLFATLAIGATTAFANVAMPPIPSCMPQCDNEHLAAVQKVLSRHDADIKAALKTVMAEVQKKYPIKEIMKKPAAERIKLQQEMMAYSFEITNKDIYPKFLALIESSIADAKALKVPEEYQAQKDAMISMREQMLKMVKSTVSEFEKSQSAEK